MTADSEDDFWGDGDSSGNEFWREIIKHTDASTVEEASGARRAPQISRKQLKVKSTNRAERGVGTDRASSKAQGRGMQGSADGRKTSSISSVGTLPTHRGIASVSSAYRIHDDAGSLSGADCEEVETLIDTDTESSAPPTRGGSFASSVSRASSMTSVSSVMSVSTTNKKRAFGFDTPCEPSPASIPPPSPSSRKKTRPVASSAMSLSSVAPGSSRGFPFSPPVSMADRFEITSTIPSPSKPSVVPTSSQGLSRAEPSAPSEQMARYNGEPRAPRIDVLRSGPSLLVQQEHVSQNPRSNQARGTSFTAKTSLSIITSALRNTSSSTSSLASPEAGASMAVDNVFIIAHDRTIQAILDAELISWGVQYEIARGICAGRWSWTDVTKTKILQLRGTSAEAAPRVAAVMASNNSERVPMTNHPLWAELDREEEVLSTDSTRGLGLQGEWHGDNNWYGGRIRQVARLVKTEDGFSISLEKMLKRTSTRFARFLGSRRVLQVSIPSTLMSKQKEVRDFFARKFVLCGRVFVPFATKEGKVFMMEINEDYERTPRQRGDQFRISLDAFVEWHNPLGLNGNQPTSKWITRFDLGLSTTVPVLRFQGVGIDIEYIPDQYAPYDRSLKKAPTENIFTDGCGYMNGSALTMIGKYLGFSERPTVVQGRFTGSKGLWTLHPTDQDPTAPPRIWIRPSQQKVKYRDAELDSGHLTFDLVAPPRVTIPSRLSRNTIMNLSHNGVPDEVFIKLMEDGLTREVEALTAWSGPHDLLLLWNAVNQVGHVSLSRIRQYASSGARVLGFGRAQDREEEQDEDDVDDGPDNEPSVQDNQPRSVYAAVLELLQAGFHPLQLPLLYDKLRKVVEMTIEGYVRDFRLVVPLSAEAFIIPDPFGVLEEGQIHFKSSQNLKDPLEDPNPTTITGEVLIYRNPARVPSDVRKVTAVSHPSLAKYVNVIVLPVKGRRSLANILAGGDVDGDVCVCIFDPTLVDAFRNSSINDPPPGFKEDNFEPETEIEIVSDLNTRLQKLSPVARRMELQKVLLSGLSESRVGIYSNYHEVTAYSLGYDHPETLRNAFMFTTVLDSRKTGLKVKKEISMQDQHKYDRRMPDCMASYDEKQAYSSKARLRRKVAGPFVLDQLLLAGRKIQSQLLAKYDRLRPRIMNESDSDLLRPFKQASQFVQRAKSLGCGQIADDLERLKNHVNKHIAEWRELTASSPSTTLISPSKSRGKGNAKGDKEKRYNALASTLMRCPPDVSLLGELPTCLETIMASYAYEVNARFAFSVAFRSLCKIKADTEGSVAFSRPFADVMTMPSAAVKVFSQAG